MKPGDALPGGPSGTEFCGNLWGRYFNVDQPVFKY
jgi:hypothetical protein